MAGMIALYDDLVMVQCACGTDAVGVWHDPEGAYVELSFWSTGTPRYGLRQRLRGAWAWLRGRPYADMVTLTPRDVDRLVAALRKDA